MKPKEGSAVLPRLLKEKRPETLLSDDGKWLKTLKKDIESLLKDMKKLLKTVDDRLQKLPAGNE